MTQRIQNVSNLQEAKDAKLRTSQNHLDGFRPIHTDKTSRGYKITWDNTPDPPDPKQTEKNRLRVLTQKILDDTITDRELVEYERLKLII